jgi:hypothetical protein
MPGKISAKGCAISVDDSAGTPRVISSDVESYEIQYNVDPVEVTGFGDGSKNFVPGQLVVGVTLNVFWNTTAATGAMTVLKGIVGSATSKTLSITPEVGGTALSGEFMCTGITPGSDVNGVIKLGAVSFVVMGAVAPTWS